MAGDWIKVEVGTASKTEVLRMAETLGIERRACIGLLVDYWIWLDANTRTDCVPNLSRLSLDSVMNCPGFAAALEAVGWAKWDESGWQMTVVNYDHHNGSSAKTRASEQRKKREQRRDKTGTRDREEIEKIKEREISAPTAKHYELAKQFNVDADAQWPIYLDWNANAKKPHTNLSAGFSNWIRRRDEFARPTRPAHSKQDARAAVLAGHFKDSHDGPRDITGEAKRVA